MKRVVTSLLSQIEGAAAHGGGDLPAVRPHAAAEPPDRAGALRTLQDQARPSRRVRDGPPSLRCARAGGHARFRGGGALPGSRSSRSALFRGHSAWSPGFRSAGAAREIRRGATRPQRRPPAPGVPPRTYALPPFLQFAAPAEGDPQLPPQGPEVHRPLHREAPPAHPLAGSLLTLASRGPLWPSRGYLATR